MRIKKFERETGPLAPFWSKSRQFRAAKTNATSVATSSFSLLCFAFFPFLFYPQKKVLPPSPSLTKKNFGRVVKALDLKSNGFYPRRFEPCSQRVATIFNFVYYRCIPATFVDLNNEEHHIATKIGTNHFSIFILFYCNSLALFFLVFFFIKNIF